MTYKKNPLFPLKKKKKKKKQFPHTLRRKACPGLLNIEGKKKPERGKNYLDVKGAGTGSHGGLVGLPLVGLARLRGVGIFPSPETVSEAPPQAVHPLARRSLPLLQPQTTQPLPYALTHKHNGIILYYTYIYIPISFHESARIVLRLCAQPRLEKAASSRASTRSFHGESEASALRAAWAAGARAYIDQTGPRAKGRVIWAREAYSEVLIRITYRYTW